MLDHNHGMQHRKVFQGLEALLVELDEPLHKASVGIGGITRVLLILQAIKSNSPSISTWGYWCEKS